MEQAAAGERAQAFSPTLKIISHCAYSPRRQLSQVLRTLKRGLPVIEWERKPRREKLIVAAGGPSLSPDHFGEGDIAAVNNTLGWLLGMGIAPKYWFVNDPGEVVASYAVRHPDITYCVASVCHDSVFDALDGLDVRVWHTDNAVGECDILPDDARLVWGGTTMAGRSPILGYFMGYRDIELHGVDSSYAGGRTHVDRVDMNDLKGKPAFPVDVGDERYWTNVSLLAQAQDIVKILRYTEKTDLNLSVKGYGLLPAMIRADVKFDPIEKE